MSLKNYLRKKVSTKEEFAAGRKLYYATFSKFFVFSEDEKRFDGLSKMLDLIEEYSLNDEVSRAVANIKSKFDEKNPENLITEFDDIFHTPPSPLRNSLSFYDEGYEVGHACADVRKILAKTNIRRDESKFKENEDNVGFVFTLMNEFIGKFDECEEELFKNIINPNIDEFIENLYEHKNSEIYKDVAVLLNEFIAFERVALNSPKPVKIDHKKSDGLSRSESIRREKNRIRKLKTEGTYAK